MPFTRLRHVPMAPAVSTWAKWGAKIQRARRRWCWSLTMTIRARFPRIAAVKRGLQEQFTLTPSLRRTGGPARYYEVAELGLQLGLITPLTGNFCSGCNRVRVTATGTVYGCLGRDQKMELRDLMRAGQALDPALDALMRAKPNGHDFHIAARRPAVARHMSVTGG